MLVHSHVDRALNHSVFESYSYFLGNVISIVFFHILLSHIKYTINVGTFISNRKVSLNAVQVYYSFCACIFFIVASQLWQ